jgi:hypothetical protein
VIKKEEDTKMSEETRLIDEKENKRALLRVSIADGVIEDNLAEYLGWIFDPKKYDSNFKRKPEHYGRYENTPK